MTVPGRNGVAPLATATAATSDMRPLGIPFDEQSSQQASCSSHQHQQSSNPPSRSRTNWSLWPLKMPSSTKSISSTSQLDQPASTTATSTQSASSSLASAAYPTSNSSSPPSPFGPGNQSDSSPPSTPSDYTSTLYATTITNKYLTSPSQKANGKLSSPQQSHPIAASPSSRNNIFTSPVVSPVPAPRLQSAELEGFAINRLRSRSTGKNFDSNDGPITHSPRISMPSSISNEIAGSRRPSYGRANTEEREREMDRVRRNNAEVDFRLCPVRDFHLGEGRHCTVYLGSFRRKRTSMSEAVDEDNSQRFWTLCAIKRLHADRQSQLLGLEEAFALRRLGPHPNVVGLISIRDEVELAVTTTTSSTEKAGERSWSGVAIPLTLSREQQEEMQFNMRGLNSPTSPAVVSHLRSSSDSLAEPVLASEKSISRRTLTHRRQVSTPTNTPIVKIASPEGDEVFTTPTIPDVYSFADVTREESSSAEKTSMDPPRLLMLLELLPYSLSSFVKKNADKIDLMQWKRWAIDLTGVVEWLHSKGCVHADLKPENVLLTSDLTVKLCDFNSALFPTPNMPLTDGLGLGTPAYGAPELASRSSKGFSYPVDIWSLGAILYTLAVGAEPFRKARSMIDILHRKGRFFESEENDRIASLSVAEGRAASLNGGSTTASRQGSLRGRKRGDSEVGSSSTTRPTPAPKLQRELSSESISSIASSVMLSGSSGQNPSFRAVRMLLEPSPPIEVLIPQSPSFKQFKFGRGSMSNLSNGPHRATSLGKGQSNALSSPAAGTSHRVKPVLRPVTIQRRTSYGGVESLDSTTEQEKEVDSVTEEQGISSNVDTTSGLRLAVTAVFAQSSREEMQRGQSMSNQEEEEEEDALLHRPYKDGSPALILPGGGRLPDKARDLLESMLNTDASKRPTATQVKYMLQTI